MNHTVSTINNYLKQTNSFLRFLIVGLFNTSVGLSAIFIMQNGLHFSYYPATFIGNGLGAAISFFLNRSFTFHSKKKITKSGPAFIFVILVSYFCAYTMSDFTITKLESFVNFYSHKNVAVLLGSGLYTILNYLGQKYMVFTHS